MSYLVSDICIDTLKVFRGKKVFKFVNEVEVLNDEFRLEMKTDEKPEEYLPLVITIKHSKLWFVESKLFGNKENVFIPSLLIKVKVNDEELELMDRVLLNDHIGYGFDMKSFLLGGSQRKYTMIYNGLNIALEQMRTDCHRLVNFTLEDELTTYAERGFLDSLLRLRDKFGNFDFEVIN